MNTKSLSSWLWMLPRDPHSDQHSLLRRSLSLIKSFFLTYIHRCLDNESRCYSCTGSNGYQRAPNHLRKDLKIKFGISRETTRFHDTYDSSKEQIIALNLNLNIKYQVNLKPLHDPSGRVFSNLQTSHLSGPDMQPSQSSVNTFKLLYNRYICNI